MDLPITREVGVMQDRISTPSASTEQQPHCPRPHPNRGPCSSKSSVSTYRRGVSGGAVVVRTWPFTRSSVAIYYSTASSAFQSVLIATNVMSHIIQCQYTRPSRHPGEVGSPHDHCLCGPDTSPRFRSTHPELLVQDIRKMLDTAGQSEVVSCVR